MFLRCASDFGTSSYRYFYYAFRVALLIINSQAYVPDVLPLSYSSANGKVLSFKVNAEFCFEACIISFTLPNLNIISLRRCMEGAVLGTAVHTVNTKRWRKALAYIFHEIYCLFRI